ncbi:She10 protein [Maudiozyma humilis]|uniref:She10 protein n=1 Tax=Maudiozyma humilis TaxID=51915 RepID=A0AAV5RRQ1_MAUHU|nr:She10 protein [Kazachstania humilis]
MKFCRNLLVFLIAVISIHHYCEWNHCSRDVKQFCHNTSPSTLDSLLVANVPAYKQYVAPKTAIIAQQYNILIAPHCRKLSKQINEKVTKPVIAVVGPYVEKFEGRPYVVFVHKKVSCLLRKICTSYNIYLQPYVSKIERDLGIKTTYGSVSSKYAKILGPYYEKVAPVVDVISAKGQELQARYLAYIAESEAAIKEAASKAKQSIESAKVEVEETIEEKKEKVKKIAKDRKAKYDQAKKAKKAQKAAEAPSETTSVDKGKTTPMLDQEIYSDLYAFRKEAEEMDDEDFERLEDDIDETFTSTSTIVKVVTMQEGEVVGTAEPSAENSVSNLANEMQIDFDNWTEAIEAKMESVIDLFEKDVNSTMDKILKTKNLTLKKMLKTMSNSSQDSYEEIENAIEDIDCLTEIDPKTGDKIYFDKTGTTQLAKYVDRAMLRDLFENANNIGLATISQVNAEVGNLDTDVYFAVENLRKQYAEIYEEWANVMVNEWSKRLAYVDVVDADSGSAADKTVSEANWKKFLKVKKQIINRRDEFAIHPVSMDEVIKFSNMVQNTLLMINRENGEYLYILRSKANLAFQKREKEEAEMAAFDAEDEEEEVSQEN